MRDRRIFVLCENNRQFESFCQESKIKPLRDNVRFLYDFQPLIGMNDFLIIRYGTWYKLPDELLSAIEEYEKRRDALKPATKEAE